MILKTLKTAIFAALSLHRELLHSDPIIPDYFPEKQDSVRNGRNFFRQV